MESCAEWFYSFSAVSFAIKPWLLKYFTTLYMFISKCLVEERQHYIESTPHWIYFLFEILDSQVLDTLVFLRYLQRTVSLYHKIDNQWEFSVWLRELKQGLCINLEGWDGERDGREVQEGGDICLPMADSCWGLTENKILSFN